MNAGYRALVGSVMILVGVVSTGQGREPKKWSPGPLAEARQRFQHGNYDEAKSLFEKVRTDQPEGGKFTPAAIIGLAQCSRVTGNYDAALTTLTQGLTTLPDHPDLLAVRADLRYFRGQWDEAMADADKALTKNGNQLLARWTRARILRDKGQLEEADKVIRAIVRYYTERSNADDDITDPDELLIVAEAGAENARWHNLSRQFNFILNEVIGDALKIEPDQYRAEILAGEMLLEKYNRPDAVEAFDKALKINPKAVAALVGKGRAALLRFELKDAEHSAEEALQLNGNDPAALRLKADIALIADDYAAAEALLVKAVGVSSRDPQTLGRLAATYYFQRKTPDFDRIVKQAESYDSKPGQFYFELADTLEERKRYQPAEVYFKKATELRPMIASARNGLGLLYLRLGDEKQGRDLLTKAFETDPFNVRVANSLKVLKHLDKYKTITTEHYELRYDPTTDAILAAFLAEYLEETHTELKRQFGYEPPGRVLIEVFSTHEMFSGRTVGLPDLHTIGACTGKVVAMASPHAKGVARPFNWGRVIRHELTHIFNLAQTEFLCPHWLTEGLAVRNEKMSRPPAWSAVLRDRFLAKDLFNLDTVMMGFVRPKNPDEWSLAYCQSHIYVEYLVQRFGEPAVGKLLQAYREGKDTGEAIRVACGIEKAEFEKGYMEYVAAIVKPLKSQPKKEKDEKAMTFEELEAANKKNPDDLDVAAKLADQLFRKNKAGESRKLADTVLAKKPGHALAAIVKSRLLARAGDDGAARVVLEDALKDNPDEARILLALGRLYIDEKEYDKAAKLFEHGRVVAPLDGDWLEQLARLYKMTNEVDKLLVVLKELIASDPDELEGRIRLAKVSMEAGKAAEAERFAREAMQIDVKNEEARKLLLEALKSQGKEKESEQIEKRFAAMP